jgi:Rha family phage regulatory protein
VFLRTIRCHIVCISLNVILEFLTYTNELTIAAPIVRTEGNRVFATSRDVAAYFEKRHDHVLRDIDELLRMDPEASPIFGEGYYTLPATGQQKHRMFEMDRDGFTLLAMGFTGPKALKFKLAYIKAFNEALKRLKGGDRNLRDLPPSPVSRQPVWFDVCSFSVHVEGLSMHDEKKLNPAPADDVMTALMFALRFNGKKRVHYGDEFMAKLMAQHLVAHMDQAGFVIMKKPPATCHDNPGHKWPAKIGTP